MCTAQSGDLVTNVRIDEPADLRDVLGAVIDRRASGYAGTLSVHDDPMLVAAQPRPAHT
jgi:hypothetical protein